MKLTLFLGLVLSIPAPALPILDQLFPAAKWNQQCKDLANDLIAQNGIENTATADPRYVEKFRLLRAKREEYAAALAKNAVWKSLDEKIRELNDLSEKVIQRQIDGLQKDAERLARRDNLRDKMRAEAAAAQIPGLKTLLGKKRREVAALSVKREAARQSINQQPAVVSLLNEIYALDGETRGHWLYEQFAGREGSVEVQSYTGKSPFFVYTDGGRFLGYRTVLPGGASLFMQLHSDCRIKEKAYAFDTARGSALINASLCAHRPEYAQILRQYHANGHPADLRAKLIDFIEDTGSIVTEPTDFDMPKVDQACAAMYPATQGVVPFGDPAAAANR